jgi:hypothetical protein
MKIGVGGRLIFAGSVLVWAAVALGDADGAKKDLAQAQADVGNGDMNAANNDIQLAEAELDGVDDATKGSIQKDIDTLKKAITDAQNAGAKQDAQKKIDSMMNDAKSCLDAKQSFDESDKAIQDYLGQPDVKSALGDEAIAKYLKELSTYRKVATSNAFRANLQQVQGLLDQAEKDWPDKLKAMSNPDNPGDQQTAADDFQRELDQIEPMVKDFPADKPEAVAQINRFKVLKAELNVQVFKAKAAEAYSRLKDSWDSYAEDRAGWEQETTGPSFQDMLHNQGDKMSALMAPKSVALIQRANNWLEDAMHDEVVAALSESDSKIKGLLDGIKADRQTAWTKLAKAASAVLDDAEKAPIDKESRDRLEQLAEDDLRLDLEGSPQLKALQARAMKLVGAFDQKQVGDAAAQEKLYNSLVDQATKAWPGMVDKASATEGLDAVAASQNMDNFKGKTILLKGVKNRMGWDYSPDSGYDFAMTIDSVPVAGKFDPALKKAFDEIAGKTGKDFSDEQYDVIATVDGMGPVVKIARAEGTIKTTEGESVGSVTSTRDETVQAIRLKIIGLHVGPLAGTTAQGVVNENGDLATQ